MPAAAAIARFRKDFCLLGSYDAGPTFAVRHLREAGGNRGESLIHMIMVLHQLNVEWPHHISLRTGETPEKAIAVREELAKRRPLSPLDGGTACKPVARELSLCRTARLIHGLDELQTCVREVITEAGLPFLPDTRKMHVSL